MCEVSISNVFGVCFLSVMACCSTMELNCSVAYVCYSTAEVGCGCSEGFWFLSGTVIFHVPMSSNLV